MADDTNTTTTPPVNVDGYFMDTLDSVWPDHTPTQRKMAQRLRTGENWDASSFMSKIGELRNTYVETRGSDGRFKGNPKEVPPVPVPSPKPITKSDQGAPRMGDASGSGPQFDILLCDQAMLDSMKLSPQQINQALQDRHKQLGGQAHVWKRASQSGWAKRVAK